MAAADPRLIVGLDVADSGEAQALVERLDELVGFYKVGLTLLAADGLALSRALKAAGKQVFQDWKLHDIGAQVEGAAASVAASGCDLFTVHAEPQVMAAAVRGRGDRPARILAVTVMTSLSDADLREIGYADGARTLVERRVRQAVEAGCDGRGGQPAGGGVGARDRRPGLPGGHARACGRAGPPRTTRRAPPRPPRRYAKGRATWSVARPIIRAQDPRAAAQAILEEMAAA
jgi:orotidine-5'-phosphate decarboxylase